MHRVALRLQQLELLLVSTEQYSRTQLIHNRVGHNRVGHMIW